MSEYGPGVSLQKTFAYDKERIKNALNGKLVVDENENGFVYAEAPKEECDAFIISAFDNAVYHCIKSARGGRALRAIMDKHKCEFSLTEYMAFEELARRNEDDAYQFDDD